MELLTWMPDLRTDTVAVVSFRCCVTMLLCDSYLYLFVNDCI